MAQGFKGRVFIVGICGIPGSGKSSALKRLQKTGFLQRELDRTTKPLKAVFVKEPSKLWRSQGWLQRFYSNPDLYAAAFQLIVFDTHIEAVENAIKEARTTTHGEECDLIVLVERTMIDQMLFWKQQVDLGQTTADSMYDDAYMRIWKRWNRFIPAPSVLFFFQTSDLQGTMRRVKARARAEELGFSSSSSSFELEEYSALNSSQMGLEINGGGGGGVEIKEVNGLTVEYQEKLLQKHQEFFTEPVAFPPHFGDEGIPCKHINVDAPYHVDDAALRVLAKEMISFMAPFILPTHSK